MISQKDIQRFKDEAKLVKATDARVTARDLVQQAAGTNEWVAFESHGKKYAVKRKRPGVFMLRCLVGPRMRWGNKQEIIADIITVIRYGILPRAGGQSWA